MCSHPPFPHTGPKTNLIIKTLVYRETMITYNIYTTYMIIIPLQVIRERLEKDPKCLARLRLQKKKAQNMADKNASPFPLPQSVSKETYV